MRQLVVDHDLLHSELTNFASKLTEDFDVLEALQQISVSAASAIGLGGAGVTLSMPGGTSHHITATDAITMSVERKQDELQQGVCVAAMASAQVVAVDDLNAESRWPEYRPFVLNAGFNAVAGVPVRFQQRVLGAVNLYGKEPRAWSEEELAAGQLVADLATGYLVNSYLRRDAQSLAQQLQRALDTRVVIEQAKGILAGRHAMDTEAAFEILRGYARHSRTKLHEVSQNVVTGAVDPVSAAKNKDRAVEATQA